MNKSSIITVLGTAALGLIKSKIGSGLRLAVKKYVYLAETYDFNADTFNAELAIEWIQSLEPMIKDYGFELVSVDVFPRRNHTEVVLKVKIRKPIETERDLQHYINKSSPNWEVGPGNELGDFLQDTIEPFLRSFQAPIRVGHDYEFGYEAVPFNADTGKEYVPESRVPRLRIR